MSQSTQQIDPSNETGAARPRLLRSAALAVGVAVAGFLVWQATPAAAGRPAPGPTPVPGEPVVLHVGDLDASVGKGRNGWSAKVTIVVHTASEGPAANVTIAGRWSGGAEGTVACLAKSNTCVVTSPSIPSTASSITFEIDGVTAKGGTYDALANHDPDGSSDGTAITVTK